MNSTNYRKSLYPNLLAACMASEERGVHRRCNCPKIVMKSPAPLREKVRGEGLLSLRWNPAESSHKVVDWEAGMRAFEQAQPGGFYYEWTIPDHNQVRIGERFQMIMEGERGSAVVMSGVVASQPFAVPNMNDGGRPSYRIRLLPDCMIHPSCAEYNA